MPCPVTRPTRAGDFLDRHHQRKRQQHGPADAVAELRAGLAVGADPGRIVVGGAGDQAGAERLEKSRALNGSLRLGFLAPPFGVRGLRDASVFLIALFRSPCPRSSRSDNDPDGLSVPGSELARGASRHEQAGRCDTVSRAAGAARSRSQRRGPAFSGARRNRACRTTSEIAAALPEMRPAVGMQRNDDGIGKRARGLDGVVGVHGEMERPAGLRRAGERQHHAGLEAARHLGDAVVPDGVAGDVDRAAALASTITTKPMTSPDKGSIPAGP